MPVGLDKNNAQLRTAMQSKEHLKRYLEASDKRFLVFNAAHLVDALPWPEGVQLFQGMVSGYRDDRRNIPSGWLAKEKGVGPDGKVVEHAPIMLEETLSLEETEVAIAQLQRHAETLRADLEKRGARKAS